MQEVSDIVDSKKEAARQPRGLPGRWRRVYAVEPRDVCWRSSVSARIFVLTQKQPVFAEYQTWQYGQKCSCFVSAAAVVFISLFVITPPL